MGSRAPALQLLYTLAILLTVVSAQTCIKRDRDALLKFKAGLDDPEDQLQSWNATSNCCKGFVGVTCNSKGEVINVTFAGRVDDDCDEDCPFIRSRNPRKDLLGPTLSKLLALQTLDLRIVQLNGPFPTGFSALKNLSYLSLTALGLQGSVSADIFKITSLRYLAFNGAKGGLTDGICKLTNLEVLDITETVFTFGGNGNGIGGTIPSCIGDLQQLREFLVEWNNITGTIPASIAKLQKLQQLKLTGNFLTGPIPSFLGQLKALEVLYLQGNEFSGSIPSSLGYLSNLKDLRIGGTSFLDLNGAGFIDLKFTNIVGTIPATLGNLKSLQTLWIKGTKITGTIPSALGNAKMLTDLELEFNVLTGSLPSSLSGTNLTIFQVNDNQLSGGIPPSYGNLRNLERFVATRNRLTAPIPKELSKLRLSPVGVLDLSDNMITGTIPEDLGLALPFGDLNLSYNRLSGSLKPSSWYQVRVAFLNNNQLTSLGTASIPEGAEVNMQYFDVHSNLLSGPIPDWPFQFYQALAIDLSDNKFTSLPTIAPRLQINYINVSNNQIYGNIPEVIANSSGLSVLDMSRNKLYGSIPHEFGSREFNDRNAFNILDLSYNDLTGTIPKGIYDGTFFNTLNLRNNKLVGQIPERSDNNIFLREVDVTNNMLTGSVPNSVLNSSFMTLLKVGNNRLTGGVPDFTGNCFSVVTLVLENNNLTGPLLPAGANFESCSRLEVFDVSGNKLTGELPQELSQLTSLKVLDVSFNELTGPVKSSLSSLSNLLILDLSSNKFSGAVPWKQLVSGFTALQQAGASSVKFSLQSPLYEATFFYEELGGPGSFIRTDTTFFSSTTALNVSYNSLSGTVDRSIGELKGLHALDLRRNKFSGTVPDTIADITDLDYLDLSYNEFSGPINPKLRRFPARAFEGNLNLCGAPLPKSC